MVKVRSRVRVRASVSVMSSIRVYVRVLPCLFKSTPRLRNNSHQGEQSTNDTTVCENDRHTGRTSYMLTAACLQPGMKPSCMDVDILPSSAGVDV